ncbi:hypothetical protein DTO271G3_6026 [Paecilomyces variotii]|nr:hypothetical protein DTO271G3_6026 [Paecilomyces variotii]
MVDSQSLTDSQTALDPRITSGNDRWSWSRTPGPHRLMVPAADGSSLRAPSAFETRDDSAAIANPSPRWARRDGILTWMMQHSPATSSVSNTLSSTLNGSGQCVPANPWVSK